MLFSRQIKRSVRVAALIATCAFCSAALAQDQRQKAAGAEPGTKQTTPRRAATIHWQRVPLRDAISRLKNLFSEVVFVDRRIDPTMRVNLDIEATSAIEVISAIAADRELGVERLGGLVYLGPTAAAEQLGIVASARSTDVARMPADVRASLQRRKGAAWPRLSEPRGLIMSLVEQRGWRLVNAEKIPHDLWSAGELPDLSLADHLTVLLIGFDLIVEFRPNDRSIEIVPLSSSAAVANAGTSDHRPKRPNKARATPGARHVYTLRVQEQPVRAVLQELTKRLHWSIKTDDELIRAAGRSLDTRVSFSVENADQEQLLEALLKPAGLDYRFEDDRVRIIARRYEEK